MPTNRMHIILYHQGAHRSNYYLINDNGVNRVLDFIMEQHKKRKRECIKMLSTMKKICEYNRVNKEMFNHEEDNIYVIKNYQMRIYGFFDKDRFIMCRATRKKRNKADPKIIKRTKEDRTAYLEG